MVNQKHVFWQSLIVAIIVFVIGFMIGVYFESFRAGKIDKMYAESEINLLDTKTLAELFSSLKLDCELAVEENMNFANRIYGEASLLDAYEEKSRLTDVLETSHKRYDVLRTLLWINSIKLKEKCKNFHTLVYFYKLKDPEIEQKAEQNVFSNFLFELKEQQGDSVVLIPIAADVELNSLNILKKQYNITRLPSVLVDEKEKIESIEGLKEISKYLK